MSQAPRRISSKRVGSNPYSSLGRPATALKPTFGTCSPSQIQAWPPSSVSTSARRLVGELLGEAPVERVGRLHDVVVDRDDRGPHLGRLGLGEERDPAAAAPGAAERLRPLQILE